MVSTATATICSSVLLTLPAEKRSRAVSEKVAVSSATGSCTNRLAFDGVHVKLLSPHFSQYGIRIALEHWAGR